MNSVAGTPRLAVIKMDKDSCFVPKREHQITFYLQHLQRTEHRSLTERGHDRNEHFPFTKRKIAGAAQKCNQMQYCILAKGNSIHMLC